MSPEAYQLIAKFQSAVRDVERYGADYEPEMLDKSLAALVEYIEAMESFKAFVCAMGLNGEFHEWRASPNAS